MRHESVDGVVVRVRDYSDRDRYLSVLTAEHGRITILSKGGHSLKGPQTAVSQMYSYANFEFYRRGDFNVLKGGALLQHFYSLSTDIDRLNLAAYLCDLTCELTDEGEPAEEMLRLLLNALYAISRELYPQEIIKGAFEWRAMVLSGYMPDLSGCSVCQTELSDPFYLQVMNGALLCADCLKRQNGIGKRVPDAAYDDIRESDALLTLSPAVTAAMRYCTYAPLERLFSFSLEEAERKDFAAAAQTYTLSHLGRGFDSLNFYHTMRSSTVPAFERTPKETKA